jgi:hypothetical protein
MPGPPTGTRLSFKYLLFNYKQYIGDRYEPQAAPTLRPNSSASPTIPSIKAIHLHQLP